MCKMRKNGFKMTNGLKMTDICDTKSQKVDQMANWVYRFSKFPGEGGPDPLRGWASGSSPHPPAPLTYKLLRAW